jgi:hypothetical protein
MPLGFKLLATGFLALATGSVAGLTTPAMPGRWKSTEDRIANGLFMGGGILALVGALWLVWGQ